MELVVGPILEDDDDEIDDVEVTSIAEEVEVDDAIPMTVTVEAASDQHLARHIPPFESTHTSKRNEV